MESLAEIMTRVEQLAFPGEAEQHIVLEEGLPGAMTYMLPENRNCFLKGWKNKGLQEVTASETRKMGG